MRRSEDSLVRKKPLFPLMYGFFIQDIRDMFNELAEKGIRITQSDVLKLQSKLANIEAFIKYLISMNKDYDDEKSKMMERFNNSKTLYGQTGVLREWFALLNTVVGDMYFDVALVDRYESHS